MQVSDRKFTKIVNSNWRLLGSSWGSVGVCWEFICGSSRVHWGSLEVIGELLGVHLEFDGSSFGFCWG